MSKKLIIILAILVTLIIILAILPITVKAFSWKNLFWPSNTASTVQTEAQTPAVFGEVEKKAANAKYLAWEQALAKNDIRILTKDSHNFTFSETEINYLIENNLAKAKNPEISSLQVVLNDDGLIRLSGDSLVKYLKGPFVAEVRLISGGGKIGVRIEKVSLRGIPLPKFIVANLIEKDIIKFQQLLAGYRNYQGVAAIVKNHTLSLKFQQ